jgi:hypothetical protein
MRVDDQVRVKPSVASAYFYPVRTFAERLRPAKVVGLYGNKAMIDFEHLFRPEKYRYLILVDDLEEVA